MMSEPGTECCGYRDHLGEQECLCPEHTRSLLHPLGREGSIPLPPKDTHEFTGQQWGVWYALIALDLGDIGETKDILNAVLNGKWDNHKE